MPQAPSPGMGPPAGLPTKGTTAGDRFNSIIDVILGAAGIPRESRAADIGNMVSMLLPGAAALKGLKKGPIKAYHGSPHDFDKFDLSKVGTGEGAAAYGHGLYFAGAEDTASYYKHELTQKILSDTPITYGGVEFPHGTGAHRTLHDIAVKGKAATIRDLKRSIEFNRNYAPTQAALQESFLQFANSVDETRLVVPQGRMYEVQINADPEHLLDWDATIGQQSEPVQRAFHDAYGRKAMEKWRQRSGQSAIDHVRGSQAYDMAGHGDPMRSSESMKRAGLPGIKYLDQGTRLTGRVDELGGKWFINDGSTPYPTRQAAEAAAEAAGQRTHNYVMFDDSIIDILKKWGLLPAAVVGHQMAQPSGPPPKPKAIRK